MDWWSLDPVTDEHLRIVKEEHGKFQAALGALTLDWADLEHVLRRALRHYADVTPEVGRALFSGTRARGAIDAILSIAHNVKLEEGRVKDLEEIFRVIKSINTMRDFLVHHIDGSMIESDDNDPRRRKVSSVETASRIGKGQALWVSSEMVYDMCHDITECCWRLQAHWEKGNDPFRPGRPLPGELVPWRYKHPQPIHADK